MSTNSRVPVGYSYTFSVPPARTARLGSAFSWSDSIRRPQCAGPSACAHNSVMRAGVTGAACGRDTDGKRDRLPDCKQRAHAQEMSPDVGELGLPA